MIDLVCLVADKNMEAALQAMLARPEALGIRNLRTEILRHPGKDPGCFNEAAQMLRGYRESAQHALVLMDLAWDGAPADTGEGLERLLGEALVRELGPDWAQPVVIDPELEVWVFADSPHVAQALGWADRAPDLRAALRARELWSDGMPKPSDPKAAVEWALREVRKPRSSAIYREIAQRVTLTRCQDRAFLRLRQLLGQWFPPAR
jgi:hypothetical protein